jgi:HlyD family secretion protein
MMETKFTKSTWGVLLVSGLLLGGCFSKKEDTPVRGMVATEARLKDAVRLTGTVRPVDSVGLKSEVSGRILSIPVKEGDSVKKGQLLVQLDPEPFQLKCDRAALQVERAQLVLRTAQRDVARLQSLVASGTVSKDQIEDLETARSKADLDVRDARISLREARKDLANSRIVSPMTGQLIALEVAEGEVAASAVGANSGTLLGTVADPSRMKVVVEVGELDFPRLRLGMPVEISTEAIAGRPLKGKVTFISSSARPSATSGSIQVFPVEVTADEEANKLVPGMTVAVDFVFLQKTVAVAVPYEAIQKAKPGRGKGDSSKDSVVAKPATETATPGKGKPAQVLVRGPDGKMQSRQVRIGETDFRMTEIVSGLKVGDSVFVEETSTGSKAGGPMGRMR